MKTVTIIGAGNVGTTLGVLLKRHNYMIKEICSRSLSSAERAQEMIGAGVVVAKTSDLTPVDICLVATSDNAISVVAEELLASPALKQGTVVFHCSGATPSSIFAKLNDHGAAVASVHPVKTFTSPAKDADTFAGTWCGIEGDIAALEVLGPLFEQLGAHNFAINGEQKTLYHTAIVFICNYLFPLLEVGLQCYEAAGVSREVASLVVEPILHATVDNALRLGPGKALTGPIARGDDLVVAKQLRALAGFNAEYEKLYAALGIIAVRLSTEKGVAPPDKLLAIQKLFAYDQ